MKIAARHNIDARVAAKAASGRVIQMIPRAARTNRTSRTSRTARTSANSAAEHRRLYCWHTTPLRGRLLFGSDRKHACKRSASMTSSTTSHCPNSRGAPAIRGWCSPVHRRCAIPTATAPCCGSSTPRPRPRRGSSRPTSSARHPRRWRRTDATSRFFPRAPVKRSRCSCCRWTAAKRARSVGRSANCRRSCSGRRTDGGCCSPHARPGPRTRTTPPTAATGRGW